MQAFNILLDLALLSIESPPYDQLIIELSLIIFGPALNQPLCLLMTTSKVLKGIPFPLFDKLLLLSLSPPSHQA